MAHYDIFRHQLSITAPAYGHALWDPNPGNLYPAVEVGDVGYIREGKFRRLFNALLPANHPSHLNFGVPEYHEQLTLDIENHIDIGTLGPHNFFSIGVTLGPSPESDRWANGPNEEGELSFSCPMSQGAVLCLPIKAKKEDAVAKTTFGKWMIKHIDCWFAWARERGLGVDRMEDIILVTGSHRTRSCVNVAFPGGQKDAQVSFRAMVDHPGDIVSVNWQFSPERNRGAFLNCGPEGEDLPEVQCIFVRGFRVTRKYKIFPRLKGAAGPNPHDSDEGDHYRDHVSCLETAAASTSNPVASTKDRDEPSRPPLSSDSSSAMQPPGQLQSRKSRNYSTRIEVSANRRTRVHVACTPCWRLKIRCDGALPVCTQCRLRRDDEQCTYDPLSRRPGPDRVQGARTQARSLEPKKGDGVPPRRRLSRPATVDQDATPPQLAGGSYGMERPLVTASPSALDAHGDQMSDVELIAVPDVSEYRDPLDILLQIVAEKAPNCDMVLVHDNDLADLHDGVYDSTPIELFQLDAMLSQLRSAQPNIREVSFGPDLSVADNDGSADTETVRIATLSNLFEELCELGVAL